MNNTINSTANNSAIITPFNVFAAFSFLLLAVVAVLAHEHWVPGIVLAAASALLGFLLIIMFLVWTLLQGD